MRHTGAFFPVAFTAALLFTTFPVAAQQSIKIGVITTLSGPGAVLGEELRNGAQLAVDVLGQKVGGRPAELVIVDDQMKPEVGREAAVELVRKHHVDFVTGMVWSNVVLAAVPYLIQQKVITLGTVGGPSELAGKMCSPYLFVFSNQTNQGGEAMGKYLQDSGVTDVALMAPNYVAGRDVLNGFKRYFKGNVSSETYTKLGQPDYQAEISQVRASGAKAIAAFYPGSMGIQFIQQYDQSGLRGKIPFYGIFVSDVLTLKAQKEAALGNYDVGYWNYDLPNERSVRFVKAYRDKFNKIPSLYAAATYDAVVALSEAVKAVNGDVANKDGIVRSLEGWTGSVRDHFSFNSNHFPIQDYLLLQVVKDSNGEFVTRTSGVAFKNHRDSYFNECEMHK